MKESKKMIKYLLIEVTEDNEEILNSIPDDKIIDECIMSEDMVDRIGCPVIYKPQDMSWIENYDYSPEWDEFQKNIKVGDKVIYKEVKSTIINIDRYKDIESSIASVTIEMDESKEVMKCPIPLLVEYIARKELKYERIKQ